MVVFGRIINTLRGNTQRDGVTQEGKALLRFHGNSGYANTLLKLLIYIA